jgi:hypothetical protein
MSAAPPASAAAVSAERLMFENPTTRAAAQAHKGRLHQAKMTPDLAEKGILTKGTFCLRKAFYRIPE